MKLTYLDILEQVFHDKWKGYDKKEVDTFLHLVAEDFKELHEELSQLRGKVERQEKKIAKLESANGNGDAKNLSPEALRDKAKRVIQLARQEADKHLTEVDRELTRIKEEVQALRREKKELLNVAKGGRRALNQQQALAGANTTSSHEPANSPS